MAILFKLAFLSLLTSMIGWILGFISSIPEMSGLNNTEQRNLILTPVKLPYLVVQLEDI
jgi:hypothetical protein